MICPKCHLETPDQYQYCIHCGQELHISENETQQVATDIIQPNTLSSEQINMFSKKSKKRNIIIIISLSVIALLTILAFILYNFNFMSSDVYRGTSWGMSKDQVLNLESTKNNIPTYIADSSIHFDITQDEFFSQTPVYVFYTFEGNNNTLSSILVLNSDKKFSSIQLSDLLKKIQNKFGEPTYNSESSPLYKWETASTEIELIYVDSTSTTDNSEYVCLSFSDKTVNKSE